LLAIVVLGLLIRIGWAVSVPLLDGETYYWVWSKHLATSYLDHPPMVAYLIRLTTALDDGRLWVRLAPLAGGAVATLALFALGREMFSARAGLIAAGVFQIVPVLAGSGLFATPEAPLLTWWSLAMLAAWRAIAVHPRWWLVAGAAIGFGMLSKLTMLALPAGIMGFALSRHREVLRQRWALTGAVLAVALCTPVLVWNAGNGWATVRYVRTERVQQVARGIPGLGTIVVEQFAFTGVMFLLLWWAAVRALRRRADERFAFLLWMSLPTFLLVGAVVYAWGGAHGYWLAPAYLALAVALGAQWPGRAATGAIAVNAVLVVYAAALPYIAWLPAIDAATESVSGWSEVAARVDDLARELPAPVALAVPVHHFEAAAQLTYYTRQRYRVTVMPEPYKASVWPHPKQLRAASIIWIVERRWTVPPPDRYFTGVQERGELPVVVRGREVRRFSFWTANGLVPQSP
jgi:4-amino-4-deoxy-L-arabinose transferase-like glycosyltransferase